MLTRTSFHQEYLWANRFAYVDANGDPPSLLLLTMRKLAEVLANRQISLVTSSFAFIFCFGVHYQFIKQEGLPIELVQNLLLFLAKEGRLNSTSFASCLSSRCLFELNFEELTAVQPLRCDRLPRVPVPVSRDALLQIPLFLSDTLTAINFGEVGRRSQPYNHFSLASLQLRILANDLISIVRGCVNLQSLSLTGSKPSEDVFIIQSLTAIPHLCDNLVELNLTKFHLSSTNTTQEKKFFPSLGIPFLLPYHYFT